MGYPRNNCPIRGRKWAAPDPSTLIWGRILASSNMLSSSLPRFADWITTSLPPPPPPRHRQPAPHLVTASPCPSPRHRQPAPHLVTASLPLTSSPPACPSPRHRQPAPVVPLPPVTARLQPTVTAVSAGQLVITAVTVEYWSYCP